LNRIDPFEAEFGFATDRRDASDCIEGFLSFFRLGDVGIE
jgi:hypothetical protein